MNNNLYKTKALGMNSGQPSRMLAILFGILCMFVASSATASAQQPRFNTPIHHPSRANSNGASASRARASERLPHSVPNSAVPAATARSSASRMELDRLEHANLAPRTGTVHHAASRGTTRATLPAKTATHSAPINFAYQGPHNGTVGHHNSASQAR
jgi:hypothetical protein